MKDLQPFSSPASRVMLRIASVNGRAAPEPFDEVVELRHARAGILAEFRRLNGMRREIATAPMTDDQRAEHAHNVVAEMQALRGDWKVLGDLIAGILRRRRSDYLMASQGEPGVAAQ